MADKAINGAKAIANLSTKGTLVVGDGIAALAANSWFQISTIAASGSTLPIGELTAVFKTPDTTATAITPIVGDDVYPITLDRICKTDADVTYEEGTIEVTDDCEEGFVAMILDGFKNISGSLNGFAKFDETTGALSTSTLDIFKRFVNVVEDDGEGVYTETKSSNESVLLFILLNKNAAVGEVQNWLIVPAIISGLGSGAGLKDAQKRDLTWTKAQGYVSLYKRTVFAADVA